MPRKCTVRYLPIAEKDLTAIYDWIAQDSPLRAEEFVDELDRRIGTLASHPFLGRVPRIRKLEVLGYRMLVVMDYLVFYKVRANTVLVYRVLHGSRNLLDIL